MNLLINLSLFIEFNPNAIITDHIPEIVKPINLKEKIEYSALENKAVNIKTDDEIAYILSRKRLLKNLIKNKLTTVPIVRLPQ